MCVGARARRGRAGAAVEDPAAFDRNVELLRDGYAAFTRGDVEVALSLLDPEFVLEVHTGRADLPEAPVYHGVDGFLENWGDVTEPFDDVQLEPVEFRGDSDRLVVAARMAGRGKASGAPFEILIFHAWTMREGKAARLDIYSSLADALAGG